jgi:hypothetical protein
MIQAGDAQRDLELRKMIERKQHEFQKFFRRGKRTLRRLPTFCGNSSTGMALSGNFQHPEDELGRTRSSSRGASQWRRLS